MRWSAAESYSVVLRSPSCDCILLRGAIAWKWIEARLMALRCAMAALLFSTCQWYCWVYLKSSFSGGIVCLFLCVCISHAVCTWHIPGTNCRYVLAIVLLSLSVYFCPVSNAWKEGSLLLYRPSQVVFPIPLGFQWSCFLSLWSGFRVNGCLLSRAKPFWTFLWRNTIQILSGAGKSCTCVF